MNVDQYASVTGRFTAAVKDGDTVAANDKIGNILFGTNTPQYATIGGIVSNMIADGKVREDNVICTITSGALIVDSKAMSV